MRLKGLTTALLAGALPFMLLAAQTPTEAGGTASTELTAVELSLSGVGAPAVSVLDTGTYASTDTDTTRNARGGGVPWAAADIVPLVVGGESEGATSARSDGQTTATTPASDLGLEALDLSVLPLNISASAAADQASAVIEAATAELNALTGALGLQVNTSGITSSVTSTAASATQGLQVSGFGIDLGDLVPVDVLGALPIDVLIDLLDQLPVGAPDLQAIVDALLGSLETLDGTVASIESTGAELQATVEALQAAVADLADAQALVDSLTADLTDAETAQAAAQAAVDAAEAVVTELQGVDPTNPADLVGAAASCAGDLLNAPTCVSNLLSAAQADLTAAQQDLADATALVDQLTADLADAVSALEPLEALVDQLTDLVDSLVTLVVDLVNELVDVLGDVLTALTNLDGSLDQVVDALANGDILDVGAIDVGVNAVAGETSDASSASVLCEPVTVSVLGQSLGTPDCANPLTSTSTTLNDLLSTVEGALSSLPIAADVVPDVTLELFPDVSQSVTSADGYQEAAASVTALRLDIPSVTIDPANLVEGLLDNLSLDLVTDLLASLPTSDALNALGLGDASTALEGAIGTVNTTVTDLQTQLGDVLALLPDGSELPVLETPGVGLVVDPASTASFRPGAAAPPAPDDEPPLPTTGGGLAIIGALSLAGAAALRRRR